MKILVLNAGSSSIKYSLLDMPSQELLSSGLVERIGLENGIITHKYFKNKEEKKVKETLDIPTHVDGLKKVAEMLTSPEVGVITDPEEIAAVGHRIVHGGDTFTDTCLIDAEVKQKIRKLSTLAPLHNPANLEGVEVAEKIFPHARQIAVFDTAFHQTMPPVAYRYAIPEVFYRENRIRKYGFHGTSHRYISRKAIERLNDPKAKIITIHLGNGCSMAAVKDGQCIDTSMGLSTMNGLMMGTRSGDIDHAIIFYLVKELGYSVDEINILLSKESGMKGITGFTDMRDVEEARDNRHDPTAILATEMYAYRIKNYIGSYAAVLNGLDAIVFAGGVGENDFGVRSCVCRDMDFLGIRIDEEKNLVRSKEIREIQAPDSRVKIMVIPTNEELEIATQAYDLLGA